MTARRTLGSDPISGPARRDRRWHPSRVPRLLLLGALAGALLWPNPAQTLGPDYRLRWYVSGPTPDTLSERRNPAHLLSQVEVRRLLFALRGAARDADHVAAALHGSDVSLNDLLATGLVRERAGAYVLGFPLITSEDAQRLAEVSERFARDLADAYLARWTDVEEILQRYPLPHVDRSELAFVLVGCFSLDWDGLDLTYELGYRSVRREPPPIVRWAIEAEASRPRAVYWGSHNEHLDNGISFTSFGDFHSIPRTGFPDLMWSMGRGTLDADLPATIRTGLQRAAADDLDEMMRRLGAVMFALRSGGKTVDEVSTTATLDHQTTAELLDLLEGLGYVHHESGRYHAAIPVLGEEDAAMVADLRRLGREVMTGWLAENYEVYQATLMRVTPIGHALPFEASFWNTWHWLFGTANRLLVEEGVFADPYDAQRRFKGFVPVVWSHG
ncbi:MAG: hypothetical protein PVF27_07490 [Gemmatimonadales bacterium]|jgi:hypothetical protein